LEDRYKNELLTFLRLFNRNEILGFSYEQKDDKWILFIHLSYGVIQISGDKKHKPKDAVYVSPIIETVP